jgi:hypothetical protein
MMLMSDLTFLDFLFDSMIHPLVDKRRYLRNRDLR